MKQKLIINFIGIIVVAIGTFSVVHGIQEQITGKQSLSWPTVEGVIIESKVHRSSGNKGRSTYSPKIKYSYIVDGTEYVNSHIRFAAIGDSDRSIADSIVKKYAPNTSVNVVYNHDEPSKSVLEPGQYGRSILLIIAGIVFFGFGSLVLIHQKQLLE